ISISLLQYDLFRKKKPYISCGNRMYWYLHMKIAAKNYTDTNLFRDNEITTILTAIILLLK
ncbi:MAG TPA: hypothetical protein VFI70_02580, partial [Nitrososphaeraceae archaeon]|nr:hypothetical protein [Nitrososphaeraceae archaeon]